MKHCRKCGASAMSVHILGGGFCQECQSDLEWKNASRVHKEQMEKKVRMQYYEKGEEYVKRKWKEKYGDDDVDTVRGYR